MKVDKPDPIYARMLQQAIGGIEGEIRVCMQYFFQAWGNRAPTTKYRDMLLNTATEELGHIEMLATAVAMNLETAPTKVQEAGAADAIVGAVMGGENPRHIAEGMLHKTLLSTGMAAFPGNSDGLPFDMSHIYASGNIAADMYCNVAAESTGRVPGRAPLQRDQRCRHARHVELPDRARHDAPAAMAGGDRGAGRPSGQPPIPNSFPQEKENQKFNYNFFSSRPTARRRPKAAGPRARRSTARANTASSRTSRWVRSRCSARPVPTAPPSPNRSAEPAAFRRSARGRPRSAVLPCGQNNPPECWLVFGQPPVE